MTTIGRGAVAVALLAALACSGGRDGKGEAPASRIFLFTPPAGFNDRELYWKGHHSVASFDAGGPRRDGRVPLRGTPANLSQSAWDPETDSLFTWKKNHEGRDHLMRVRLPSLAVEPVSRFPESGGDPLLAFDTKRRRILVAPRYGHGLAGLRGGRAERQMFLYDVENDGWQSRTLDGAGLITISYSEALDRFVGLGTTLPPSRASAVVVHLHPESATVVAAVPTDLNDVLASPVLLHGPADSLGPNSPGVQSRVLGDRLYLLRYVDLGRASKDEPYDWSYEVYSIDPATGASRFVRSFR